MPRLSVCPQRHVWASAHDEGADGQSICPVCGMNGRPGAVVLTNTDAASETLSPTFVPPVVPDVTIVAPAPMMTTVHPDDTVSPTVPGYDIVGELGRGGMGVVYLARHRELKRPVALKMILAGAHSDQETRTRFRREAEAIARLQHPGIVQIHNVGENFGRPFLALEYVDGSNLAAEMAGATIAARTAASITETLARIVNHAHERGIVHRDLTPRNVLLARTTSASGIRFSETDSQRFEPKITDFGLAKELDDDMRQTQTGVVMGTPSYMAPEQAKGTKEIGPATDIHALGAILYELLTGRPPFLAETRMDTLKQVIEQDPVPPGRLQPKTPRDLETICLKCLAKNPERRYASAADLADDLQRFLDNEPILARPVSPAERMVKWIRRHPAATSLLGVVLLSLVTLVVAGALYNAQIRSERDRAENSLALAMRAIDGMLSEVGEVHLATEPRMEGKRRALLQKALDLQKELLSQRGDDPRVRFETAQAHRRMGDVFRLLERHDQAMRQYDEALALLDMPRDRSADDTGYRKERAHVRNFQGEVHRAAGRHGEAATAYRDAHQIEASLAADFPDDLLYRKHEARALDNLGIVLRELEQLPEAERQLRRAVDLLTDLAQQSPDNPAFQEQLATAYLNLGTVIRGPERLPEAQSAYDRAIQLLKPLSEKFPEQPDYRHELGVTYNNEGNLFAAAQRFDEALALHGKARDLFQTLSADFPKVLLYRHKLAIAHNSIGRVELDRGNADEAIRSWTQAAAILERLLNERPNVAAYEGDLGMVWMNIGLAHYAKYDSDEARENLQTAREHLNLAIDRLNKSLKMSGTHAVYRDTLRDSYQNLAEVSLISGDHTSAASAAHALAEVLPPSAKHQYYAACFLARASRLVREDPELDAQARDDAASGYAEQSVEALRLAMAHGFHDLEQIEADTGANLAAVAGRPDFQALVGKLAAKASNANR